MYKLGFIVLVVMLAPAVEVTGATEAWDDERFERQIRPLLAAHCFSCHGSDVQESGLRLDHHEFLLRGGARGDVLVPHKPEESMLLRAVSYRDSELQMPPDGKMPAEEIEALEQWIKGGAYWPNEKAPQSSTAPIYDLDTRRSTHWAWQPVSKPRIPPVNGSSWQANPIDSFILAELEQENMRPAKPALRAVLIRRLYFDLIGLPPAPDELRRHLADRSPDAIARLVDELLASPHFGERWGRHWLDLARYAESYGHEENAAIRNAWRYRDYVIRAYNDDVPYDQFIKEQLAGDLLENPRRDAATGKVESLLGTSFYWLGEEVHSPVDLDLARANRIDNQLDVIFKTFQALTISCARCHDHKFDAISQHDYYGLAGILQSSRPTQRFVDDIYKYQDASRSISETAVEIRRQVAELWLSAASDVDEYIMAAHDLIERSRTVPAQSIAPDIVLEDFSQQHYEGWGVEGAAFAAGPLKSDVLNTLLGSSNPPNGPIFTVNAVGSVACSHPVGILPNGEYRGAARFNNDGGNLTGALTSRPFTINRRYLHFSIAGGSDARTALEIIVDGEIVRRSTGREEHPLRSEVLDLGPWMGRAAVIRLVDERTDGSYAYICISTIVLSDEPLPPNSRGMTTGSVRATANLYQLKSPIRLARWVAAIAEAKKLLHSLAESAQGDRAVDRKLQITWATDGPAFLADDSERPVTVVGSNADHPISAVLPKGWRHSGVLSPFWTGTLLSSGFTLDADFVHVRVFGDEGQLNLRVADTTFCGPPIYEGLKKHVTGHSGEPCWVTFSVAMWKGRRAYLECVDHPQLDSIDVFRYARPYAQSGSIGVQQVVLSDQATPPAHDDAEVSLANAVCSNEPTALQGRIASALNAWKNGEQDDEQSLIISWLAKHGLLQTDMTDTDPQYQVVGDLITMYRDSGSSLGTTAFSPGMAESEPINSPVYLRGDVRHPGDAVPRAFLPAIVGENQSPIQFGSGRRELAAQIASQSNPLTARVIVNRIWHHLFGRGIVATVDNFGQQGEAPTHPALLDYLANRFMETGWSQKNLIREIVLSKTYQMSSVAALPEYKERDPENRLLHRANVRRLEAEAIRDALLAVSGRLDRRMFGEPIPIPRLPTSRNKYRQLVAGPMDGEGRRSIYIEIDRNELPLWYSVFDGPRPFTTIGARDESQLPSQSLMFMNDPFVIDQAAIWAKRVIAGASDARKRVEELYLAAFARFPEEGETRQALDFLALRTKRHNKSDVSHKTDIEAWRDLCHALLNTKEFIYLE